MESEKDIEKNNDRGQEDEILEPLIPQLESSPQEETESQSYNDKGSVWMVLFTTFVAVCGSFEFGSIVGYSAPTESGIMTDLHLSLSEYSVFGSTGNIGAMIGAVTSGRITDFIGRKWAMRMSCIFCIAGWVAIYFSKGVWSLDIGRLFTGYGMGVFSYVVPVFIAEITPKNLRGALATMNQLMIIGGVSFSFIIGTVVSWRTLALIGIIPSLVMLVGLFLIPESPRWLAKVGKHKQFEVALQKLRGKNANISDEAAEIQNYIETLQQLPKTTILDLFQRRYWYPVIIGVGLMVFQQFGGINGICFYLSYIFEDAGFPSKVGSIVYSCIQIPLTAFGAFLIDRSGRKPLLYVSASGLTLGCILTGIAFFLKAHDLLLKSVPLLAFIGIMIFIGSFSIGMGAIPWVIMSEIFPINIKGTAGSLVTLVNWSGSWVVSLAFNFLMSWSSYGTFILFAAVNALAILFIAKMVPETKGRTLEEIQASLNNSYPVEEEE